MNTQLRIAFVLAFNVIGGAALAEDGGVVGTPTSKAGQAIAAAAHLAEAPQVEAHDVPLPEAPRQEGNGVEAPQLEAHDVPLPEAPRQESNGVEAPQLEAHAVPLPEASSQEGNGIEAPQLEAHDVPQPEVPRQEGNGVEAPQVGSFTATLSPLVGSRP
jgi:hypothetical protein